MNFSLESMLLTMKTNKYIFIWIRPKYLWIAESIQLTKISKSVLKTSKTYHLSQSKLRILVYQWFIDLWLFKILSVQLKISKKAELIKWLKEANVEELNKEELDISSTKFYNGESIIADHLMKSPTPKMTDFHYNKQLKKYKSPKKVLMTTYSRLGLGTDTSLILTNTTMTKLEF